MFGIGTGELVMILIIAMLVVGPEKMVQLSKQFGQLVAKFRQQTDSVTHEFREALSLEMEDKDEAASQLPSGTTAQPESARQIEGTSPAVAESASGPTLAAVAVEPASAEDQIAADGLLQAELEAAMFDGEIEVAADGASVESAGHSTASDQAIDLDVAELVPEDVDVQPTLIGEPVLIADEPASDEADEPSQDKA